MKQDYIEKIQSQLSHNAHVFNTLDKYPRMRKFMRIAHSVSCMSSYEKYKIGAIIILKGQIIATGYNQKKTHTKQKHNNSYRFKSVSVSEHPIHAELDALNKTKNIDLSKAEMIIYHVGDDFQQKIARPCDACMFALNKRGIKKIHYSTPDSFITEDISGLTFKKILQIF